METRTIRVILADDEALAAEWQPQVIVLDLKMPGPFPNPAALLAWLHTHHPGSAVLPLTGHGREALPAQLMEAGAAGYLEKTASAPLRTSTQAGRLENCACARCVIIKA